MTYHPTIQSITKIDIVSPMTEIACSMIWIEKKTD